MYLSYEFETILSHFGCVVARFFASQSSCSLRVIERSFHRKESLVVEALSRRVFVVLDTDRVGKVVAVVARGRRWWPVFMAVSSVAAVVVTRVVRLSSGRA